MKNNQPITQNEVHFSADDIIVSITDTQGVITSVSPAFCQISGYTEAEMLGQNHNMVRHPDMPPEAFEWLWRTVKTGKTWNARVKNRAKNGDFYWVDATVLPLFENNQIIGYRSLRVKPSRAQVDEANKLYNDINAKRIKNPFIPGKFALFISQLKLRQKFMILVVLAVMMCAIPTCILTKRINDELDFSAKETQGITYIRETIKLLQLVQQHRNLAVLVLAGDSKSAINLEAKQTEVNLQLKALDTIDSNMPEMGMTNALKPIRSDWENITTSLENQSATNNLVKHAALTDKIFAFNRTIGDVSNLALDPVLDSYYLIIIANYQLSDIAERLSLLASIGGRALEQKTVSPQDIQDLQKILGDLPGAQALLEENIRKVQVSDSLRNEVQKISQDIASISQLTTDQIIKPAKLEFSGHDFVETTLDKTDYIYKVSADINDLVNDLVNSRIANTQNSRLINLLGILSLLAVNLLLTSWIIRGILRPVTAMSEALNKLGRGEMPSNDGQDYGQEMNQLKEGLNLAISSVRSLISDTRMLVLDATNGKLSSRADADKHQGDYRKIVQGINNTLDAVIGPLNVAATYVENISKGAIPAKITDNYNGDFNVIKTNINTCIDAVNALVADAVMLSQAAVEGKLSTRADDTKHQGDYRKIVQGVNNTLDAVIGPLNVAADYVDNISKGSIPTKITDTYNGDFNTIKNNLNNCIDAINNMVTEAANLEKAAIEGHLATRADASQYQGDYRKIVQGVNNTLDAVIGPLNVAADYVDNIAKGAIPAKITDNYNGDFNVIKTNLNTCIDAVNALVADAVMLSQAAVEGKLSTRANDTKHQGDYRKIVQGVNNTLDAVIGPLNVAADYVDNISKGLIPAIITDTYNGDFNTIKNNLNNCIDAISNMVTEAANLEKAAIEGHLATRADASQYQGDYRKIVQGVNNTLDAVIGPLNVAAEYVDNIAKGAIPAKITDNYNGDFNVIKTNLNTCIDAVNALIADAVMLSQAAVEGKLSTRADDTQHQGDYRKIVQGVNSTLDAVIGPLNVAADYVDNISKGSIPAKITDTYNGDFNTIKNNLNNCIDAISNMVTEAASLEKAAVEGHLATRADASQYQGDYRKIVQGVNNTLDAVIGPLNVAANYVDNIAKGAIPTKITDSYNGDFNVIKTNLNTCIDAVNALVADTVMLSQAAVEGKLSTRADDTQHQGDYRKIVQGVNNTLDAVIRPLNVAADYVDNISKGSIPAQIIDTYNGDFNTIKNNLNTCIGAINNLVADANMLSIAAVEGQLQTRADASQHQGDFRKIVQGFNDTLDGVILPVNEAVEVLTLVEQGDLTRIIRGNYKGQLGDFKDTVNNTIAKLSQTISEVISSADQLGNASEQISATSQSLSQASSEQAASVEQTSASIEEMAASINQNAENAKVTDGMASKASHEATEGGVAVKQTVDAMKEIANKIGIIDDIAYQTNMLALNAAIEAARAGDHGKGFAVVASEVRKLAERSQVAAAEIGTLAETSVKTAESAGRLLDEIVPSIAKTSDLVQEIAAASHEQSSGVSQINTAMNQMSQITQQNASASEQLAATAEEMTSQTEQLQSLMSFFKITGSNVIVSDKLDSSSTKTVKVRPTLQHNQERSDDEFEFDLSKFQKF
ncbi:methyl-accepting chemotaxis protein [Methylomonas sp. AM2-LC]|uniref:methyl-accepting chemotaxis protein n=1 Tax=Methylomonas sp. AM2-LC TaxID=3153301 RepID=UPI003267145A